MADISSDWSTNANDAVTISLVTPNEGAPKTIASFHPKFTYSIFGDEESIFGYQGLKIHLRFNACDMRPGLTISYNKKFKTVGETAPTDIKPLLEEYLPSNAFEKSSAFDSSISDPIYKDMKPPGELYDTIQNGTETYEIWKGSLADPRIQQLIKRIQILVPFFIEGGTLIDLSEPEWSLERWTIFFLFKKSTDTGLEASPYVFMGYSTVYRYYLYQFPSPPSSPNKLDFSLPLPEKDVYDFPCRSRISQFIILPAFQGKGCGAIFYESIFQHYLKAPQTMEITVEDPNEAFDDLRDLNDLTRLRALPEFTALKINTDVSIRSKGAAPTNQIIDPSLIDALRLKTKIAPRQFSRLVEMHLLSQIPTNVRQSLILVEKTPSPDLKKREHEYHLWQVFVKTRLYRHNKQSLMQLERAERIDKLEDALSSVEADYARLLRALDQKKGVGNKEALGKRSAPHDEDEFQESGSSSKKARIEESEE